VKPPTTKVVLKKPTTAAQRPPTGPAPAQKKPPTGKVAPVGGAPAAQVKPPSGKTRLPSSKIATAPVEPVGSGWGRTILIGLGLLVVGAVIGYFGLMLLAGSEAPGKSRSAAPPSPPALPSPAGKSPGASAAEPAPSGAQNPGGGLTVTLKDYRGKLKRPTVEAAGTANSFRVGSLAASDRGEAWTKVPAELSGLPRLLTAREDRGVAPTDSKYVVSVSGPGTIYVPLDPAYGVKPLPWMDGSWQDSGLTCETTKGTDVKVCRIWKRPVAAAGEVTLGCDTQGSTCGMCYVFAGAAEARP